MAQEDNTADRRDSASLEDEARRYLIGLYHETNQTRFLSAALQLQRQGTDLDEADFFRIKHGSPVPRRSPPTIDDTDKLWIMAALARREPDLVRKPHALAKRAATACEIAEHNMNKVVKRLVKKWKALPRQDGTGISAAWWADRVRDGGYAEDADQLLSSVELIRSR
jgi:hypothetical protein